MGKIRYTASAIDQFDEFDGNAMEMARVEIEQILEDYVLDNIKVVAEDDYCIKENDQKGNNIINEGKLKNFNFSQEDTIVLFYPYGKMPRRDLHEIYCSVKATFPENKVIALPDGIILENCSRGYLKSIRDSCQEILDEMKS